MTTRKPLVIVSGQIEQLQAGDSITGSAVVSIATDNTYISGGTITGSGTISATDLTAAGVNQALHAFCGGI